MGLDPATNSTISRNLRTILMKLYGGAGKVHDKIKWPLWGSVAAAPVLGYQLDRLSEKPTPIPDNNPELNEQRVESPVAPPLGAANKTAEAPEDQWLSAAAMSVKAALAPTVTSKQAALDQLKLQITAAKERARSMNGPAKPSTSFLDGESQSLESGDKIAPVSNQPQYR